MLLIRHCLSQRRGLSTAPEPPPFPTLWVTWAEGLHICGEQAGLAAVLGVLTHPHAAGLMGEHLLTHRGPLALSGVAPAASRVEKGISIFQSPCLFLVKEDDPGHRQRYSPTASDEATEP